MALPKIVSPTYELVIPSNNNKVKYKPFTSREHKVLLMAYESQDEKTIVAAVEQIVSNCILEGLDDINELTPFDLEYVFLHLRAKSMGEKINAEYLCQNVVDGATCNNAIKIEYNVLEAKVEFSPEHEKKIMLFDDVGVVMKYPTLREVRAKTENLGDEGNKTTGIELAFEFIISSIDCIFKGDEVTKASDASKEELVEFLENLPLEAFNKIQRFFETMPALRHTIEATCGKCGFQHKHKLEGLTSFFE